MKLILLQQGPHICVLASDLVFQIPAAFIQKHLIQLLQCLCFWSWNAYIAPDIAYQAFYQSLFISTDAGLQKMASKP